MYCLHRMKEVMNLLFFFFNFGRFIARRLKENYCVVFKFFFFLTPPPFAFTWNFP